MAVVTVEAVKGRAAFKRFVELPYLLYGDEPRWSPPLASYERSRLDPHNPYFDQGDGEYFLARRDGAVGGRIAAHVSQRGSVDGWFGFFDAIDDADVVRMLIEQAGSWLREHDCTTMTGPASFDPADDAGVLVEGFDVAGTTGRAWHPPWYRDHLTAAGLTARTSRQTWRLPAVAGPHPVAVERPKIAIAGRFVDPRIVLPGVTAVPDLTPARGSALTLARLAKRRAWTTCTIVAIDGDPAVVVPHLLGAAGEAGYESVISPWSPDPDAPPETVHARFSIDL